MSRRGTALLLSVVLGLPFGAFAKNYVVDNAPVYLPDALKTGEKLRGLWDFGGFDGAKYYADEPHMRDFANRARFLIVGGRVSRQNLATATGHPEIAHIPQVRLGHSAGGTEEWSAGLADRSKTLAVIGHNHWIMDGCVDCIYNAFPQGDARGSLPVLINSGDRDFVGQSRSLGIFKQVTKANGAGWLWSQDIAFGVSHMGRSFREIEFMTAWVEDVTDLQIGKTYDGSAAATITPLRQSDGYCVYAEYIESDVRSGNDVGVKPARLTNIKSVPVSQATLKEAASADGGTTFKAWMWMPSQRVADLWVKYHKYNNIQGDSSVQQTDVLHVLNDGIQGTWQGYEGLTANNGWNCPGFYVCNVPGFTFDDFKKITYQVTSGAVPTGLAISQYGKLTGSATAAGIYKFTLKSTFGANSWSQVHYMPLRGDNSLGNLTLTIGSPANLADVKSPVSMAWTSSSALGYLEAHSSLDGDLKIVDGQLGTSGTIVLEKLSTGTHYITLRAYSSSPVMRKSQTVVLNVTPGTSVAPRSALLPTGTQAAPRAEIFSIDGRKTGLMRVPAGMRLQRLFGRVTAIAQASRQ